MKDIKKIFGYEGSFITVTEKIFDIMFLSILWFLSCIPLLTIGAAVTALYYTVQKAKKNEEISFDVRSCCSYLFRILRW